MDIQATAGCRGKHGRGDQRLHKSENREASVDNPTESLGAHLCLRVA